MTTQPTPPPATPIDVGNQLLGETPAQLTATIVNTPAGQRLALTIRTPSTTLTLFLNRNDATGWAQLLAARAAEVSPLLLSSSPLPSRNNGFHGG